MSTLSDYIIEFLEDKGIEHCFTVSGGGSIFLDDALQRAKRMKYVCTHHEQAAAYAAEGYARARNAVGCCIVTSGPGGTNAVSGVGAAFLDGIPVFYISGQAFLKHTITGKEGLRQLGVQEINIIDIVRPITKFALMLANASRDYIDYNLNKAWEVMTTPRMGPVWLDIPGDIQNARI
jgi:acetolactate synthase-1/2/3 large subunit